jgi:ribonuclease T2
VPFHSSLARSFLAACLLLATPALAGGKAGDFDFYVLALTWTPGFCATADNPDPSQCKLSGAGFMVHGLWPEYETGFPDYCPSSLPRGLSNRTLAAIRGIMPSAGLAHYEWRKHGLCTGLDETTYFGLMIKAAKAVKVPPALAAPHSAQRMATGAIEAAFIAANPGLSSQGMAVQCDRGALTEVRICLTKDLGFRTCTDVDLGGCRSSSVSVQPVR